MQLMNSWEAAESDTGSTREQRPIGEFQVKLILIISSGFSTYQETKDPLDGVKMEGRMQYANASQPGHMKLAKER